MNGPSRQLARNALPIGVGLGATVPWCVLEVALGWQLSWYAIGLALCLGTGLGLWLVLPLRGIRNHTWFAIASVLPLLIFVRDIHWAFDRALDVFPGALLFASWVQTIAVAVVAGAATQWAVHRSLPAKPFWRWFSAAAAFAVVVITLAGPIVLIARRTAPWAGDALWLSGWLACALLPKRRFVFPFLALASGVCLLKIPDEYTALQTAFGIATVTSSLVALREWIRRWRGDASVQVVRSIILGCLVVGSAAFASAHFLSVGSDGLWLSKTAKGGLVTVIVRLGRTGSDFDRDGHGMLFGQTDCRPLDANVHPGQLEIPGNGIDDNCMLGDAKTDSLEFFRKVDAIHPPPAAFGGDLVVVLVDALRFDDATSLDLPSLQQLFRTGVFYERAYATSTFTPEALMGILAGRLPTNIELQWNWAFNGWPTRPPGGLAVELTEAGFDTAMVGVVGKSETECFQPHTYGDGFSQVIYAPYHSTAEVITDQAIRTWKSMDGSKRRFMFTYYLSVHNAISSREAYRESIVEFDRAFARLRREVGPNALWVLLADHGEEWYEHGQRGHARTLYEEVVHVPLVIAGPGIQPRRVGQVSSLRTLAPTLLAMLEPPRDHELGPFLCIDQGVCKDQVAPFGLRMQTKHLHGLVIGHRKVIRNLGEGWVVAFDLQQDPNERQPLPRVPDDLARQLDEWEEFGFSATGDNHLWPYAAGVETSH